MLAENRKRHKTTNRVTGSLVITQMFCQDTSKMSERWLSRATQRLGPSFIKSICSNLTNKENAMDGRIKFATRNSALIGVDRGGSLQNK
jgi:hypothetical protein